MRFQLFSILIFLFFFSRCEFNISTARLTNTKICGSFDGKHGCLEDYSVFDWIPDTIFVSSRLLNAPSNTEVRYYWYQMIEGNPKLIDSISYFNKHSNELIHSYFTTNNKPLGDYKVILKVIADNQKRIEKTYSLTIPSSTAIHQVSIGKSRNELTNKVEDMTAFFTMEDEAIYFSATLYNLKQNAPVRVIFYHVQSDEIIDEVNLITGESPEKISQLSASLPITSEIPYGGYQLFVDVDGIKKVYEFELN